MDVDTVRSRYAALAPSLTERSSRLWAAREAMSLGHGGIAVVERATGISRSTIERGIREVRSRRSDALPSGRTRRPGGGRKRATEKDPTLLYDLDALVEPATSGDPDAPLRWTSKSVRQLAEELKAIGHDVSYRLVAQLLKEGGYSLQANRKTSDGRWRADHRDAQFRYIDRQVRGQLQQGRPAISVDAKKKELVGDCKNPGRESGPEGNPEPAHVHDFFIPEQGAIPQGAYDLSRDEGWVNVGIDHDSAGFAVNAIRRWWKLMGSSAYGGTPPLLIMADVGGSYGSHVHIWKWELQKLANQTGLSITVCHFPPGTSRWNKIEHRLSSHIAMNWSATPLVRLATVVCLIGSPTTTAGLRIRSEIDDGSYPLGVRVTAEQMATIRLEPHTFRPDWNYSIHPS